MTYAVPHDIDPTLSQVRAYWERLRRGGNTMPFWDDVKISDLKEAGKNVMLFDAFENPRRFRINFLGQAIAKQYGSSPIGEFLDEIASTPPFDDLNRQCGETVKQGKPTYYRNGSTARIVLPMWGNGHIEMLLGVVDRVDAGHDSQRPTPETIAADLTIQQRLLLFCLGSDTDWISAGVMREAAQHLLATGLIEGDNSGYVITSEGRQALKSLLRSVMI